MSVGLEVAQTTGSLPVKSLRDARGEPGLVEGKVGHLGTSRECEYSGCSPDAKPYGGPAAEVKGRVGLGVKGQRQLEELG